MSQSANHLKGAKKADPEAADEPLQHQGAQYVYEPNRGKYYRVWEGRGEVKQCDQGGSLIKPFNPNLTGKFQYNTRLAVMRQNYPNERTQDLIELPLNALASNASKNYSPQPNKLDGYAHMPRHHVLPYFNKKLDVKRDWVSKQYMKKTMHFFGEAQRHMSLERAEHSYDSAEGLNESVEKMPEIVKSVSSAQPPAAGNSLGVAASYQSSAQRANKLEKRKNSRAAIGDLGAPSKSEDPHNKPRNADPRSPFKYIASKWNIEYVNAMKKSGKVRSNMSQVERGELQDLQAIQKMEQGMLQQRRATHSQQPNLYSKNKGTSYLVAPINISANSKMIDVQQSYQDYLRKCNMRYLKKYQKKTPRLDGQGSAEQLDVNINELEQQYELTQAKENPGLMRTQQLAKLFDENSKFTVTREEQGSTTTRGGYSEKEKVNQSVLLNNRALGVPHRKFQRRFAKKNHFLQAPTDEYAAIKMSDQLDGEAVFDQDLAGYAFASPTSKASLNPMFMNTKSFNVATVDYRHLMSQKQYEEELEISAKQAASPLLAKSKAPKKTQIGKQQSKLEELKKDMAKMMGPDGERTFTSLRDAQKIQSSPRQILESHNSFLMEQSRGNPGTTLNMTKTLPHSVQQSTMRGNYNTAEGHTRHKPLSPDKIAYLNEPSYETPQKESNIKVQELLYRTESKAPEDAVDQTFHKFVAQHTDDASGGILSQADLNRSLENTDVHHGSRELVARYDRGSKQCVKNYNIKTFHKTRLQPFFSETSQEKINQFKEIQKLNLDGKRVADNDNKIEADRVTSGLSSQQPGAQKGKGGIISNAKAPSAKIKGEGKDDVTSNGGRQSAAEAESAAVDDRSAKLAAQSQEHDELLEFQQRMMQELLPGQVKSKWAISHKFDQDQAVIDSLAVEEVDYHKRRTKGLFQVDMSTNAGNWVRDRDWKFAANEVYKSLEVQREAIERKLLSKKKEQKRIQYMALENQYKLHVKTKKQ